MDWFGLPPVGLDWNRVTEFLISCSVLLCFWVLYIPLSYDITLLFTCDDASEQAESRWLYLLSWHAYHYIEILF